MICICEYLVFNGIGLILICFVNIVGKIWDNLLFCWEECEGVIVGYLLVMLVQVGVVWLSCALMI